MTPLKALALFSALAIGIAAQPTLAANDDAPAGARSTSPQTVERPQAAPKSTLSPEERKAKRAQRRMMKQKRQQDGQLGDQPRQRRNRDGATPAPPQQSDRL